MPTWQIFPTDGGHFRWSLAGGGGPDLSGGGPDRETLAPRLPSMADLVLQAPSKLLEGRDRGGGEGAPTFRTGSGRSVSVRESSIRKARSLLDGGSDADRDVLECGSSKDNGFSMFHTGSGRSVTVKSSSLRKATTILEREDLLKDVVEDGGSRDNGFSLFHTGSGRPVTVKQSSLRKATAVLEQEALQKGAGTVEETGGSDDGFPMFRTGLGKSVMVKQSSIKKAVAVLEGDLSKKGGAGTVEQTGGSDDGFPMFRTGLGKSVMVKQSSIKKAVAVLEGDTSKKGAGTVVEIADSNDGFPMFHTGSGKSVTIRQSSIRKAAAVLEGDISQKSEVLKPLYCGANNDDVPKFQTGSGKSVMLKQSSIRKAMAILQDGENIETDHATTFTAEGHHSFSNSLVHNGSGKTVNTSFSVVKDQYNVDEVSRNKENMSFALFQQNAVGSCYPPRIPPPVPTFTSPMKSSSTLSGTNSKGGMRNQKKDIGFCVEGTDQLNKCPPSKGQLMDISNFIHKDYANISVLTNDKKRPWRRSSISPFKRPRICRFTTPVNNSISVFTTDSTKLSTSENHPCRTRLSTHYPFKFRRKTLKEFFGGPPTENNLFGQLPAAVRKMNAVNAEIYRFCDSSGLSVIGPEAFQNILLQSGAISSSATNEWVANHYKWIVWKLACFERCYPAIACGKLLTASNVLEELKYRYEREVNYGHRSAIKKILDGDASPASMMVLCISSIPSSSAPRIGVTNDTNDVLGDGEKLRSSDEPEISHATKIELTDGWYSLDAVLDVSLSKHLVSGKLFVGQKLQIWGASLCGWGGPTSPLEASKTISLLIHMNGTYRAHWSSPLGFCKGLGVPLAFRCIKESGGKVPRTLVGVTRIYPILYKERFHDGGSIVRSERMENKVLQLYNQRRSNIAEDIMAEKHDELVNSSDSEEGARLYRILETSAEPDVLMADMSSEQLLSFSTYQAKQEAVRQTCMEKKIEKALDDACLSSRDVTPFMRVRVVGLTSKGSFKKGQVREGLITIWNPTEKQKLDLVEGQIYSVSGLIPRNFSSNILHLQAKGSSTVWKPLASVSDKFEPFFTAREAVPLSNLGEVPLTSEFDIAGVVLHVGEVYISGCRKKQWVFLTDGSRCISKIPDEELNDCVLAVSFCSPMSDNDTAGLLFPRLLGTIVCFCNLVKRAKDQMNHLWIGEATENSTYSVCYNLPRGFHLKEAADSAKIWAKESSTTIHKLRERILCIIGGHGS